MRLASTSKRKRRPPLSGKAAGSSWVTARSQQVTAKAGQ
nr:MAG TPA: hypothetical protein [Caudoviricetes sp.]